MHSAARSDPMKSLTRPRGARAYSAEIVTDTAFPSLVAVAKAEDLFGICELTAPLACTRHGADLSSRNEHTLGG